MTFMAFESQVRSYNIKLLIPLINFAKHNFGPLRRILFVIVLFNAISKTLCTVLFSNLYLQMSIFYYRIYISGPSLS
jgi:hypothetical protein